MKLITEVPQCEITHDNYGQTEPIRLYKLEKGIELTKRVLVSGFGIIPLGKYLSSKWVKNDTTSKLNSTIGATSDFVTASSQDLSQRISNYSNNCGNSCNESCNNSKYSIGSGIKKLGAGLTIATIIGASTLAGMEAAQINAGNEQTKQRLEQLVDTGNVSNYFDKVGDFYFK